MTMPNTGAISLESAVDIGFLDPKKVRFSLTPGGFTALKYDDKEYPRISLRRALPIAQPMDYISVADGENKEIGIIKSVQDLPNDQLLTVTNELNKRYFCPEIREVKSVKDKLGYVYMELALITPEGNYEKNCAVKDINKNIRMLDDNRLLIFDVDGNRYIVPALSALDKKSLKRLEPYMF